MTHEFKTPLASILIASTFLSQQEAVSSDEKLKQYSQIIIDQGKKLDSHLEKILNVAKNDNNPMLLNKEPVNIIHVIDTTIGIIQLKYPDAVIKVNNNLQQAIIQADPFHFANIMYNFLDNSIKYCHSKPAITIDLKNNGSTVVVQVTDNGIGIHPKHLKHIFEKFYRAPGSKELAVNGFGLGLYYVKKICELHQWKLSAASEPGKGTGHNFNDEINSNHLRQLAHGPPLTNQMKKYKILYAEDDQTLAFLTRDNLEQHPYEVDHFANGEQCLKAFNKMVYDVCVLDVMMPGMDGFALAEAIRKVNHEIPIIFLSAKTLKEDKLKGLRIGADDYLVKPFSIEELVLKIEIFIARSKKNNSAERKIFTIGSFQFDPANFILLHNGKQIELTQKEAALLQYFIDNKKQGA